MAGTYELPAVGEANFSADPKVLAALKGYNESLNTENDVTTEGIAKGLLGRLYAPKITATEETRENVAFGTLTTKDEITGVVLPENGLIQIGFVAKVKSSVAAAGTIGVFLGANQILMTNNTGVFTETAGTGFNSIQTTPGGLGSINNSAAFVTTGQTLGKQESAGIQGGGFMTVFAAAGTYTVSIQYKASSGSITAKERKLWVGVAGV